MDRYVIEYHVEFGRAVYRTFNEEDSFNKALQEFETRKTGTIKWTEAAEAPQKGANAQMVGEVTIKINRADVKVLRAYEQEEVVESDDPQQEGYHGT